MYFAHWARTRGLILLLAAVMAVALLTTDARALGRRVMVQWLSAELLKLPRSRAPGETREEFEARVQEVSEALVDEARPFADGKGWALTELAAAAGVIWQGETMFDRRIQSGEGHPVWNQDHGLARCGMQLHVSGIVPQEVWERLVGADKDALHLCAQYGLRVVVAQARQCGVYYGQRADRDRVAKTLASYANGGKCVPTDRDWQRADRWVRIMAVRPDHEKKEHPGFRRAAPREIPDPIQVSAEDVRARIGKDPTVVPGYERQATAPDGRRFALLVERHAENKIGVSVLIGE
jgi:hypothetical protein